MSALIKNTMKDWLKKISIIWFVFFSLTSLGSCFAAAFTGPDWTQMSCQQLVITWVLIFVNWGQTMMAFLSKAAKKLESGQDVFDENIVQDPAPPESPTPAKA